MTEELKAPMDPVFDARAYTWRSDGETSCQRPGGMLSGCRLVVKDLFHVTGIPTGAGNPDWLASHPVPDTTATVVSSLLAAGASLVGKTQTDELAYSLNGLNRHYGAPLNPAAPSRLPGGSSTGSAVAVAAGEADLGLGSDTGGSIRVPASYNGLFGIRPTHGLVSTEGMVPLAPPFDTVGWMARDAGTLLCAGQVLLPGDLPGLRTDAPLAVRVLEPRIADASLWSGAHDRWLCEQDWLSVSDRVPVSSEWLAKVSDCFRVLQGRQIWQTHGDWITQCQPVFADDIQARIEWCRTLSADDERAALVDQERLRREVEAWMTDVDVVVLPTTPGPAPRLDTDARSMNDYRRQLMGLTAPAGLAGLPQLHLPVLTLDGAPAGISLMGRSRSDRLLLQLAYDRCSSGNHDSRESLS